MNSKDYQDMAKWVKWKDNTFNSQERAVEKQLSRELDTQALKSGLKTRDELRKENGAFAFPNAKIDFDSCKKLG